jgi:hypothetical protein
MSANDERQSRAATQPKPSDSAQHIRATSAGAVPNLAERGSTMSVVENRPSFLPPNRSFAESFRRGLAPKDFSQGAQGWADSFRHSLTGTVEPQVDLASPRSQSVASYTRGSVGATPRGDSLLYNGALQLPTAEQLFGVDVFMTPRISQNASLRVSSPNAYTPNKMAEDSQAAFLAISASMLSPRAPVEELTPQQKAMMEMQQRFGVEQAAKAQQQQPQQKAAQEDKTQVSDIWKPAMQAAQQQPSDDMANNANTSLPNKAEQQQTIRNQFPTSQIAVQQAAPMNIDLRSALETSKAVETAAAAKAPETTESATLSPAFPNRIESMNQSEPAKEPTPTVLQRAASTDKAALPAPVVEKKQEEVSDLCVTPADSPKPSSASLIAKCPKRRVKNTPSEKSSDAGAPMSSSATEFDGSLASPRSFGFPDMNQAKKPSDAKVPMSPPMSPISVQSTPSRKSQPRRPASNCFRPVADDDNTLALTHISVRPLQEFPANELQVQDSELQGTGITKEQILNCVRDFANIPKKSYVLAELRDNPKVVKLSEYEFKTYLEWSQPKKYGAAAVPYQAGEGNKLNEQAEQQKEIMRIAYAESVRFIKQKEAEEAAIRAKFEAEEAARLAEEQARLAAEQSTDVDSSNVDEVESWKARQAKMHAQNKQAQDMLAANADALAAKAMVGKDPCVLDAEQSGLGKGKMKNATLCFRGIPETPASQLPSKPHPAAGKDPLMNLA